MRLVQAIPRGEHRIGRVGLLLLLCIGSIGMVSLELTAGDVILVIRPDKPNTNAHATFEHAMEGLIEGLANEFLVFSFHINDQKTTVSDLRIHLDVVNPNLVVLMGDSVQLYNEYQKAYPERSPFTPAVILMTIFVERKIRVIENSVGIEYQIQGITSLVNFRSLLKTPVSRVGVVYHKGTERFFERQRDACKREQIELVGIRVRQEKNKVRVRDISAALKKLIVREKVDALWMLNDPVLINRKMLEGAWTPKIKRYKVPVVVGVERFVTEDRLVGHFAVVPDPFAMGYQASEMILNIKDNEWKISNDRVHAPIGVYKLLNKKKLSAELTQKLDSKGLLEVDRIIQ